MADFFHPTKGPARETVDEAELSERKSSIFLDDRRRRPRYFDGRFLAARDLTRDQEYMLTRQSDLGRALGPGVAHGLEVRIDQAEPARRLRITQGHGLTPAGEVVLVRQDMVLDLLDIAQAQQLDAVFGLERQPRPPTRTRTGLFVLCLRPVEYTANPVAAYPTSLTGDRSLQDGEIVEAVAFTLVPWPLEGTAAELDRRRSDAAREIFLLGSQRGLPAEALPLAMIALDRGLIRWVDPWLVRRELGVGATLGFGRRALREAFIRQYDAHLQQVIDRVGGEGGFAAADHFSVLPPFGRLPPGVVKGTPADAAVAGQGANLSQTFFPGTANMTLSVVPDDELPALAEDALALPPIDLSLPAESLESLEIAVLVPVRRADFAVTVRRLTEARPAADAELVTLLEATLATLPNPHPLREGLQARLEAARTAPDARTARLVTRMALPLARVKPLEALYKLKTLRLPPRDLAGDAVESDPWLALLAAAPTLWYVRRRHTSHASDAVLRLQRVAAPAAQPQDPIEPEDPEDPEDPEGPVDPPPEAVVIPEAIRERIERARELPRYERYVSRLAPAVAERLFQLMGSDAFSAPMVVSGLITELDPRSLPAQPEPPRGPRPLPEEVRRREGDFEEIVRRYDRIRAPEGIQALVKAERELNGLEIRQTISLTGRVPELDALAEGLTERGQERERDVAAFLLAAAREGQVGEIRAFIDALHSRNDRLSDLFWRRRLGAINPGNANIFRELAAFLAAGGGEGLRRAAELVPTLVEGDLPERLDKLDLLGRLDAVARRVPPEREADLRRRLQRLGAARNDDEALNVLAGLEELFP